MNHADIHSGVLEGWLGRGHVVSRASYSLCNL